MGMWCDIQLLPTRPHPFPTQSHTYILVFIPANHAYKVADLQEQLFSLFSWIQVSVPSTGFSVK